MCIAAIGNDPQRWVGRMRLRLPTLGFLDRWRGAPGQMTMNTVPFRMSMATLRPVLRRSAVLLLVLVTAISIVSVVRERRLQEQVQHDVEPIEAPHLHIYLPLRNSGEFLPGRL